MSAYLHLRNKNSFLIYLLIKHMSHSSIDEAHQSNFRRKIATHRLENAVIDDNVIVDIASRSFYLGLLAIMFSLES